jgi:LmbE family N-acetylglucosaminyl deacetylase
MTALLLSPHYDDAELFAAFMLMRTGARVLVVFGDADIQASRGLPITPERRYGEFVEAMTALGVTSYERWMISEARGPSRGELGLRVEQLREDQTFDLLIAPAHERDGHEQHEWVAHLADMLAPGRPVIRYHTYSRTHGRVREGTEVQADSWMIARKLRALACHESQMDPRTGCQTWFLDGIREWVEPVALMRSLMTTAGPSVDGEDAGNARDAGVDEVLGTTLRAVARDTAVTRTRSLLRSRPSPR